MYIYHLRTKIVFQAYLLAEVVGVQKTAVPHVVGHDATNRLGHGFTGAPDLDVLEEGGKLAVTLGRVLLLDLLLRPHRVDLIQLVALHSLLSMLGTPILGRILISFPWPPFPGLLPLASYPWPPASGLLLLASCSLTLSPEPLLSITCSYNRSCI